MPDDDPRVVILNLIVAGVALQDANNKDPGEDAFTLWFDRVREFLTEVFGAGHRFVTEAEEAAQGPPKLRRDPRERPTRYFRVHIIRVVEVLRRAVFELQRRASAERVV